MGVDNLQAGSAECTPCLSLRSDFMQTEPSGYSCHFPVSAAGATTCCESIRKTKSRTALALALLLLTPWLHADQRTNRGMRWLCRC